MNLRLACDLCGEQPCMCQDFECLACNGEGEIWNNADPTSGQSVECEDCKGRGWLVCNGPGSAGCAHEASQGMCHCEAAWERQQEANASEPPMTERERHMLAWQQKQELRR